MTPLLFSLALAAAPSPVTGGDALDRKLDAALAAARAHASEAAAVPVQLASPAPAQAAIAPAPLALKAPESSTTGMGGALLLAAVAGAAWWAKRKRGAQVAVLRVVQHAGLGKGRDLVVVDHGGRRMLLGVTGASIAVLRDDEAPVPATLDQAVAPAAPLDHARPLARGIAAFEEELTRATEPATSPPGSAFDVARAALLAPRSEDEALRRKLGRSA